MKLNLGAFLTCLGLVRDVEVMFRLRAETKGLKLDVLISPDCQRSIEADEGKLRQVLINLLGNAIKFPERGSIRFRMSMTQRDNQPLALGAEVEDTGLGIAAEEQAELFRPFGQSQSGRSLQGGTGLGLAISQQIHPPDGRRDFTGQRGREGVCSSSLRSTGSAGRWGIRFETDGYAARDGAAIGANQGHGS